MSILSELAKQLFPEAPKNQEGVEPLGNLGPAATSEGVPSTVRATDVGPTAPGGKEEAERDPVLSVDRPVPVALLKIVETEAVPPDTWSSFRVPIADGQVQQVAGRSEFRRGGKIKNAGNNSAFIFPIESLDGARALGYEIAPGDSVSLDHTAEVYAATLSGEVTRLDVIAWFRDRDDDA